LEKTSDARTAIFFNKILILQTAFIGDVVLTTPLIRAVHQLYPAAAIHFLTIPVSQNLVETLPYLKRLWIFDKRGRDNGISGLLKLARRLRKEKFQLALVPHRSLRSALLVFLAAIPRRIGFDRSSGAMFFTDRVLYSYEQHEVERNLCLLQPLSLQAKEKILPEIYPDSQDKELVNSWLISAGIDENTHFITLAAGSVWFTKRWPADYWVALADLLTRQNYKIVLIGSPEDKYLAAGIMSTSTTSIIDALGCFTLRQSAELIRRSCLLISNDSAPTHLGSAVRTPVLTIFGSTVPAFGFSPYGTGSQVAEIKNLPCRPCTDHGKSKCPLGHFKCMRDLTPAMVFEIVWKMLNENHPDRSRTS
jgi:heptosyltransferase-2